MRLERRRWTGSRLAYRALARRRHPRRPGPRLRADRVRARPAAVRQHRRRGRGRARPGPRVAERQVPGAHARAVPRRRARPSREVVATGLRNPQGFDWEPGTRPAGRHRPRAERVRRPGGLRRGQRDRPRRQLRLAGGRSAATRAAAASPHRCASTASPIAPSGATFVSRPGSRWTGDFLLAALRGDAAAPAGPARRARRRRPAAAAPAATGACARSSRARAAASTC